MHQVVAEVWRNELIESVHYGSVIGLAEDGSPAFTIGQPDNVIFPRSSNKPLQALAMVRNGLPLTDELLALACASHSGEDFHLAGVRRILADAGLSTDDLRCAPDLPLDQRAARARLAAGEEPTPLFMNCSGKHAAMLATCVHNGWPTRNYLDPANPLHRAIQDTVEEMAGERIGSIGIDGCGTPLLGISLVGLAQAFRRLANAPSGSLEHRVSAAMNSYPEWVGGTGRDVTALMRALPGSVAKDGAEGVYAIGLPDGRAIALKIADGASRARPVVMVAALHRLGATTAGLVELAESPVLGHGKPVGAIRPADVLSSIAG